MVTVGQNCWCVGQALVGLLVSWSGCWSKFQQTNTKKQLIFSHLKQKNAVCWSVGQFFKKVRYYMRKKKFCSERKFVKKKKFALFNNFFCLFRFFFVPLKCE